MTNEVQSKIKALVADYTAQLPGKIKQLGSEWQAVKNTEDSKLLNEFIRKIHTLYGTAGTYGFKLVSNSAGELEKSLLQLQEEGFTKNRCEEVDRLLKDLDHLALNLPQADLQALPFGSLLSDSALRTIYILDKEKNKFTMTVEQLEQFNYLVRVFDNTAEFLTILNTLGPRDHKPPDMVILDIGLASEIPMDFIYKLREELVILVYMHDKDELMARLFTVRHSGQAFIAKPFDVNSILRLIDNLFEARESQNARILVVDDSFYLAEYYAVILSNAGYITKTLTDPQAFLNTSLEFQPDLILLDINMPFSSGLELAQVVQQDETLNAVPIIFLSTISERAKQLEVLSLAGDDFLTKPVEPKHLLAAVHNRLIRSHILRSRLMRDSLTNLYNHTMIHHQLDREIRIAERYHHDLSVALVDIDHFKEINDTYGHQAGDQILKSLSTFLHNNFRKTDLIGRYGGEEFLAILPDTEGKEAAKLVERIRKSFEQIPHIIGDKKVFITLSGGVTSYSSGQSSTKLVKTADDALYQAKNQGRNQIVYSAKK